jgi:hypothetical protein
MVSPGEHSSLLHCGRRIIHLCEYFSIYGSPRGYFSLLPAEATTISFEASMTGREREMEEEAGLTTADRGEAPGYGPVQGREGW